MSNAESRRAPALLLAHTNLVGPAIALVAGYLETPPPPEPTCRICGGAPLTWPSAPCSLECLDDMLDRHCDSAFAFFPRGTLPAKRLGRPAGGP